MKKILLAGSAMAAFGFAGAAQASEPITLSLGGYMEQWAGFADSDTGEAKNAFQSDSEVYFDGETILDNGIQVGAHIELEAETSSDQIDEQFLYISGGFGRFEIGKNDSVADSMSITAPAVGPVGVNDGDMTIWTDSVSLIDTVPSSGDQNRVTYFTPSFSGFQAGVSFASDSGRNGSFDTDVDTTTTPDSIGGFSDDSDGSGDNIVSLAVAYSGEFDGVSISLSAEGENQGEGNWYGVGANVGFGAFTVGSSWGHIEDDYGVSEDSATDRGGDIDAFDFGVSYSMDAAAISLTYAYQDDERDTATLDPTETQAIDLGLSYTLGAGVSWRSSIFWGEDDVEGGDKTDAYGAVTGLRLDF
ncbi:porin [Thalassospira profundimaris]|uniref:porin n=1 Tax=Thalassospira profundimaris TaxID=502049 RepID=UPI0002871F2D|nr:porin [Thalassospira profundimaris]EKF10120.1 porin [Thalassospira profundimaris WP0211]